MKEWNTPVVDELCVEATAYGSDTATKFDSIYQNAVGNWEGTFEKLS